jgi:hypothetical protein
VRAPQMTDQSRSAALIGPILQRSDAEATTVKGLRAWLTGVRGVLAWTGER